MDRPFDDRPLARRLAQAFAYVALASDPDATVRRAAIDAVLVELQGEPPALTARVAALRARIAALPVSAGPIAADEARALRRDLTRAAADWAGALPQAAAAERPGRP